MSTIPADLSVFVGNVPYDVTEEDLAEKFRSAGEVVRFRIQFDPNTGKTKGYGFCDYTTAEAAQTAIRTLNGLEINGRTLRVDSAAKDQSVASSTAPSSAKLSNSSSSAATSSSSSGGTKQSRDIDAALGQLTVGEAYDILVEIKAWVKRDPESLREMLVQRPVLAQALLKMQTSMSMMGGASPPTADASFSQFLSNTTSSNNNNVPMPLLPPSAYSAPAIQPPYYGPTVPSMMPSTASAKYNVQPLLPHQQQQMIQTPEMYALYQQALNMTEDQISAYPPHQQDMFRQIRASARR